MNVGRKESLIGENLIEVHMEFEIKRFEAFDPKTPP